MRQLFILLVLSAAFCGCNKVKDAAPDEPQIPMEVMQLVEKTHADPQNMVFTEILDGKIWNVQLDSRARRYSSTLNMHNVLLTYRLAGSNVPDSLAKLLQPSAVAGGTFSNFREQEYILYSEGNYGKTYLADYLWKGERYLFKWGATFLAGQATTYTLEMEPVSSRFPTNELADLPQTIQQYVQSKQFEFLRAMISVDVHSKKTYQLQLRKDNLSFELLFDETSKLIAGSDRPISLGNAGDLPETVKAYLAAQEEYKDFGFTGQFSGVVRNDLDGVRSYRVGIQKHSGAITGSQVWFITFDQNGTPLSRNYLGLY